jgi:hypothetical protein
MMTPVFLLLAACSSEPERQMVAPKQPTKPTATAAANAKRAPEQIEPGWGALFWRNATAWKVGGGSVAVGPKTSSIVRTSGEPLVCKGVATKGAPKYGALVLPDGSTAPEDRSVPAIQAHRIERAAWRLDEVLPARGRFASKVTSNQPSRQRGVEVGSVSKTRRYGSPPFLIATGVRDCTGAVVFTDVKAESTVAYDTIPQTCSPLRVIPAHDYDGDGNREFAVFSEDHVRAYRLTETPGRLEMSTIGDWSCPVDPE